MGGGGSKPSGPPPPPPPPPFNPPPPKNFQKGSPPENMKLTISGSASCPSCRIGIEADFSSSVVILSRDIMGKIPAPPPKAQSDSWVWDNSVAFGEDGIPYLVETPPERTQRCSNRCNYLVADSSVWGKKRYGHPVDAKGNTDLESGDFLTALFEEDLVAWKSDQRMASKRTQSNKKMVYMWNPSDDPKDPNGSIAVNYNNHGALTKLFLKPTLPFTVTFSEW